MEELEAALNRIFVKQLPALPVGLKKWLVKYLPWLNLIFGLFSLYSAVLLWHWAHVANNLVDYTNGVYSMYGGGPVLHHTSFAIWLGLVVLIIEAVLYIAAFNGTRARQKNGWNFLFYALLINLVYGVVIAFSDYGGVGSLLAAVIGSLIGFYFLFQIRSYYLKPSRRSTSA